MKLVIQVQDQNAVQSPGFGYQQAAKPVSNKSKF